MFNCLYLIEYEADELNSEEDSLTLEFFNNKTLFVILHSRNFCV